MNSKPIIKQGKPAFPAEPASQDLQCNVLLFFTASSVILLLLFSVSAVFCFYCFLFLTFYLFHCFSVSNMLKGIPEIEVRFGGQVRRLGYLAPSIGCCNAVPTANYFYNTFCFIPKLLWLLAAAYSVILLLGAICGAICAIYRVLSQLQITSTTLLLHQQPVLAAYSTLFCKSAT